MEAARSDKLLSASGITTGYGSAVILRDVSLHVAPAETIGLLGRNGMGKTTLLRTIMGLLPPGPGRITFDGHDLTGARPAVMARAGLALVPEGRGIFPNLGVEESLTLGARAGHEGHRLWTLPRIYELFPRLAERRRHWCNQLSGGEQQMMAIGRALMTNPRLLMLDEATEGLAPKVRDEIWTILRHVAAAGISTIIVDKNLGDLFDLADRHIILAKGEIVFEGTSAALRTDEALIHRWLGI
jgi:branched-chain amino acid transport system ATP-binding protein